MNINDGVLDDISEVPLVDGDLIKVPGSVQEDKPSITLVAGMDKAPTDGAIIPEAQLQQLPAMDASFKIIDDTQQTVVSLKEVEAEIIGQESISRNGASYVNASFEGLLDGPYSLNEFTTNNSRTHLDYVKRYMRNSIAKEEQAIATNFELLLDVPLTNAKALYEQLLLTHKPAIEAQFYELRSLAVDSSEKILNTKNAVFPSKDNTFVNIATTDICSIDISTISTVQSDVLANIDSLCILLKKPVLATFVHGAIANKAASETLSLDSYPKGMVEPTSAVELLALYKTDLSVYIDALEEACKAQILTLNAINDEAKIAMETTQARQVFMSNALPKIQSSFTVLKRSMFLINDLSVLNFCSKSFLTYLSKL